MYFHNIKWHVVMYLPSLMLILNAYAGIILLAPHDDVIT